MKKTICLVAVLTLASMMLFGCSSESDLDKSVKMCIENCAKMSGASKTQCESACEKAASQYEEQGVDYEAMNQGGSEPNPDGLDEDEQAGVGVVDNGVADGEVVGDDYEVGKPDMDAPSTGNVCDENWYDVECEALTGQYKAACYVEIASDKAEECICTNMVDDATLKDSCYMSVAGLKLDYTICDYIVASNTQDACYVALAEETESIDPCNKVNDQMFKDGCYQAIASLTGDASICDMISQSAIQTTCQMAVTMG